MIHWFICIPPSVFHCFIFKGFYQQWKPRLQILCRNKSCEDLLYEKFVVVVVQIFSACTHSRHIEAVGKVFCTRLYSLGFIIMDHPCTHVSAVFIWAPVCRFHTQPRGWSGGAKVSCILRYRGVQLILAYSWARPAILVAGKGRV